MIDVYRKNAFSAMVVMKKSSCHVHRTPAPARTGHGEDAEAARVASRLGVMPVPPVVAGMSTGNLGHLHVRASCNNAPLRYGTKPVACSMRGAPSRRPGRSRHRGAAGGSGPTAIDVSTFFKRRNLDKDLARFWRGSRNLGRSGFKSTWRRFEKALDEEMS